MSGEIDDVLEYCDHLANHDDDLASRRFFGLLIEVRDRDPVLVERLFDAVRTQRPLLTPDHCAWLTFAAFQSLSGFAFDHLAEDGGDAEVRHRVCELLEHEQLALSTTMVANNMCTTAIERYAALQIVSSLRYADAPISILDVGCSLGLGLRALNSDLLRARAKVCDYNLAEFLCRDVHARLVGLDVSLPTLEWAMACCLPKYRLQREQMQRDDEWLRSNGRAVKLIEADALELKSSSLRQGGFEIVWTSNTTYELEGDIARLKDGIRHLLKPDGIWVHAGYRAATHDESQLSNRDPYVVSVHPRDDWDDGAKEVLQTESDSLGCLVKGREFDDFFDTAR